jgi:hypothetical protein
MSRLLALLFFLATLFPRQGLTQSPFDRRTDAPLRKKLALYSKIYPVYVKGTLTGWSLAKKYIKTCMEEKARQFLEDYYAKVYPGICTLISKSPTAFLLSPVQGYVTRDYWENVVITIDNFHWKQNTLAFQVSMRGEYIKVATLTVNRESFDNAYFLEKDYITTLTQRCNELLIAFKKYLTS